MTRSHANPLSNPLHYSTVQPNFGPPVSAAAASRNLLTYDYVIIGGGTAGSILASKLSEDPKVSVLVLEAGGNNSMLETKAPLLFSKLFHTKHDWDYSTVPQQNVANRKLYWPRGRMLGGSSSMNAMIYHHCSKSDFDEWSSEHGCTGWGYDDIAPYFRRMENFTVNPNRPAINMDHRGNQGDWQTGYSYLSEIVEDGFLPACVEAGIAANEDINTVNGSLGVTRLQSFIDSKGQRSSMATAYLPNSVRQRPNLYVATNALATRVLFDTLTTDTPTAIGVEFQTKKGGDKYQVHARREVILASGAINTPQLLKLSGIGPEEELKKHNLPLIKVSEAVGSHLKDHLCASGIMCKTKPGYTLDYLTSDIKAIPSLIRWLVTGGGPLASNVGEAGAFIRVVDHPSSTCAEENKPKDYGSGGVGPDIELLCAPLAYIHHGEENARPGESVFGLVPISLRPQSSGTVTLKSDDPFEHPIIDPKYLSDKQGNDRKVLLAGLRMALKIIRSPALSKFLEPVETNDDMWSYWWPYSSSDIDKITDDQLQRFMVQTAFTLYHPIGTARMGSDPATSVVDPECKVHGVQGLRVMDASVFPEQVSGHPTAPIGAMAYKLSDMIKRDAEAVKPNL